MDKYVDKKLLNKGNYFSIKFMLPYALLMSLFVLASNILVEIQINNWLTWGAISYPVIFLITDLTNRNYGIRMARFVVYIGFVLGIILSFIFADERIALASGSAFLIGQLLNIYVFDYYRQKVWWAAPLASSMIGSVVDTCLFFSLAFYGTDVPWVQLSIGDLGIKIFMVLCCVPPYRWITRQWAQA